MVGIVSAAGLVGFLSEPERDIQVFALRTANEEIDLLWTEFAEQVGQIEALYEDSSFPERELAALVASKIYYHLQEYDESMAFALRAGKLFEIEKAGEYEEKIISKCIDSYIDLSASLSTSSSAQSSDHPPDEFSAVFPTVSNGPSGTAASLANPITPFSQSTLPSNSLLSREDSISNDPALQSSGDAKVDGVSPVNQLSASIQKSLQQVIRRIFERCFQEGAYRQVIGIAVEARNLEVLREAINRTAQDTGKSGKSRAQAKTGPREELLDYLLDICMNVIQERGLRNEILELILDLMSSQEVEARDYFSIAKCMVYLNLHETTAKMLRSLVEQNDPKAIGIAYQISFDLYDNSTQDFLTKVIEGLPALDEQKTEFSMANGHATQPNQAENSQETDGLLSQLEQSGAANTSTTLASRTKPHSSTEEHRKAYGSIRDILQGTKSIELELEFLFRSNRVDRQILTKLKNSLEARHSIFHSAVTFANAFMNSGTTSDWFIRENLDWLQKAVNWTKFSVTASLGVIHRGNIGQGQKLLEPYLRDANPGGAASVYSKGGALYALGLIYANHGTQVLEYLHNHLRNASNEEVVQHGACLGLGVAGMATQNEDIVEEIKQALFAVSAVSGQAAGLAIGLVMLGSGSVDSIKVMLEYAHETEHDKTVRGLALGMALIMYARQEAADELIAGLLDEADPTLRYGGIMAVALAYCGTSSNKAVRKLLHVAVSDVNDDVRRTAVMSLGFVLFRKPDSVPRMVELLAESYNPHVRYGATMALGIACAGTGLEEAVDLLEPMMKDSTDFVRQGAFIALSMIMVEQSEAMNPKSVTIRKHLQKVIGDRHEDAMAKFGAALALGIIDAGGRNCTIGLQTQTGNLNMTAIVGMAVFTQYWYWFPLTHFLSLSFMPTTIIGVDQDLEVPNFKLYSNSRPSMFDYPPAMEVKTEEAPEKVKTAVLSTTAQAKRRKMAKEKQQKAEGMEVDQPSATPKAGPDEDKMDTDEDTSKDKDDKTSTDAKGKEGDATPSKTVKAKLEREKVGYELDNISRVLPAQVKYISFPEGRYVPVKKPTGGVVILRDTQPTEPKSLIERQVKKAPAQRAAPDSSAGPSATAAANEQAPAEPIATENDVAAVLNAVDEDEEDQEEAQVPGEFEYHSDGPDDEE